MFNWFKRQPPAPKLPDVLIFKSNQAAFEMACAYFDCKLEPGKMLVALVNKAVVRPDKVQICDINLASDDGGLKVPACLTINESVPPLKPGDLVGYQVVEVHPEYTSTLLGQLGFVVGKLAPEYSQSRDAWKLVKE